MFKKILRYLAAASVVIVLTLAVLLARQLDLGPERPSPSFRTLGDRTAKVHFMEYTDFACPSCKLANEHLHKILELYPGKIRVSLKHYPLTKIHKWSVEAAAAADCAGKEGKFWPYAGILFDKQARWSVSKDSPRPEFISIAARLGIETNSFRSCVEDPETLKEIRLDMAEGDSRKITATPTIFMNRKRIVGAGQLVEASKLLDNLTR